MESVALLAMVVAPGLFMVPPIHVNEPAKPFEPLRMWLPAKCPAVNSTF